MRKLSLVIGLFLTLSLLSGCGGGGGGSSSSSGASVSGYVLVPTDTPTDSARLNLRHFVKAFLNRELFAASTTKPVPEASIVLAKLDTEGKLNTVNTTVATSDAQGKYTLSGIPEGNNWVLFAKKVVKDTSGNKKDLEVKDLVTIQKEDIGKTKEGEDLTLEGTIAVETVKDLITDKNSDKPDNEKVTGGDLDSQEVEEIKQIYANHEADIHENANPVDILTKDPKETEEEHHQLIKAEIEALKNKLEDLKTEIEGKINAILAFGSVVGFITDTKGNPLTQATVTATGGALTNAKTGTVLDTGQYLLRLPVSDKAYTLTITLSNYVTQTFNIFLTQNITFQKNITLISTTNNPPVISNLTASSLSIPVGGSATLTASATDPEGDPLTYSWLAAQGTLSGSGASVTYTAPSVAGTDTITLTVSDGTNQVVTKLDLSITSPSIATPNQLPTITLATADPSSGQSPLTVAFSASASDSDGSIASTLWDFGDGTSSTLLSPSHIFSKPGSYTATFTAIDNQGGSATKTLTITVTNAPPSVSISASPTTGSAPLTVAFSAAASDPDGSLAKVSWDYDSDGTADWTSTSFPGSSITSHTYTTAGTYTATFKATDDQGDTTTKTLTLTVSAPNQAPTVSASATPTSGTTPLSVQFTGSCADSDGSCASFSWDFGDGSALSSSQSPSHTYSAVGTYTATFTATDDAGATASAVAVITVSNPPSNQLPTATLTTDTSSGNTPLTVTFTLDYTDPEGKAGTYTLDFGDSTGTSTGSLNSSATTTVTHTYTSAGTYTATLTVTDDQGGTGQGSVVITASIGSAIGTAKKIAAGGAHTCAIVNNGEVYCWGNNRNGQVGNDSLIDFTHPVKVSNLSNIVDISNGNGHTCAVTTMGEVYCWGRNDLGQLGNGTLYSFSLQQTSTPTLVTGIQNAVKVSAGGLNTCVLLSIGTIKCFGSNDHGQLGMGKGNIGNRGPKECYKSVPSGIINYCSDVPQTVWGIDNAIDLSVAGDHACAVLSDGSVKCWGENAAGELGIGTNTGPQLCGDSTRNAPCSVTPQQVSGISSAKEVSSGTNFSCAKLVDGTVFCWGDNSSGQLGNGTTSNSYSPSQVSNVNTATHIFVGTIFQPFSCIIELDKTVKCWGSNEYGQIGQGYASSYSSIPLTVPNLGDAIDISIGTHACVVTGTGTIKCWGRNDYGQLGNGTTTDSSTPVSVIGFGGTAKAPSQKPFWSALDPLANFYPSSLKELSFRKWL